MPPETFAAPDDFGDIRASELHASWGERLGAQFGQAFMGGMRTFTRMREYRQAEAGEEDLGSQIGRLQAGEDLADVVTQPRVAADLPIADAKARLKQEGLEGHLKLPEQETIKAPVLDLMIAHGHERRQHEAAVSRGPQGFFPDALGFITELGAGIIDPINIAAFSIPVIGEARLGMMMARAGESLAARAGVRAGVGAAQGAVGGAVLVPGEWWLHTKDGQDYTFADALHSVVLSAGMGAAFHSGLGALGDVRARRQGRPLPGSAAEQLEAALARHAPGGEPPVRPNEPLRAGTPEQGGIATGEPPARETSSATAELPEFGGRQAIHDDVLAQLTAAGMDPHEAAANAAVVAARYAARAERLGESSALALYRREGLEIRRGEGTAAEGRSFEQKRKGEGDLFAQREGEGQQQLPVTERIGQGEQAQRGANAPLKPKVGQKPADEGLFSDQAKQKSFFQHETNAPAFYSAVARTIAGAKQDKASAEQWLGTLKNTPGVKGEELAWLGLEDWLKGQKGAVSKQAIADYVRVNSIEVREVTKAAPNVENARKGYDLHPKFSQWQLPGGENYRELLLTLPEREQSPYRITGTDQIFPTRDAAFEHWQSLPEEQRGPGTGIEPARARGSDYKSSHWDEPNVLAHVRFNDRTIDGKKTLFLEEIQSDWHQAGKRKGYQGPKVSAEERTTLLAERDRLAGEAADQQFTNGEYHRAPRDAAEYHRLMERITDINEQIGEHTNKVPDAPFKTTWPELALKRMIRFAAEEGYEQIAWTSGETQAARYDLSKQIKSVKAFKNDDGTFSLNAVTNGDDAISLARSVPAEKLSDYVGKDLADKIAEQRAASKNYSGLDLKVGGEGMAGFYDKLLPAAANKLAKKYGAKVERGHVATEARDTNVDTPFEVRDRNGEVIERGINDEGYAQELAQDAHGSYDFEKGAGRAITEPVHTLTIPPAMREAALGEGFPLFQRGAQGGEPQGRITLIRKDGAEAPFAENKAIVELFGKADQSTFMHEMGHKWLDELGRDAARANVPQALKDDLGTVLRWLGADKFEDLTTAQHEQWARGFEQYLAEGKAPTSALAKAFEQFKAWLTAIYRSLADLGTPISDDIRGVMDRMLASDRELAVRPPHPAEILADLPPRVREDVTRAAIADVINGNDVRAAEMLAEAAKESPRIAESLAQPAAEAGVVTRHVSGAARGPRAAPEENWSLLQFIASRGGIDPNDPLIGDVRSIFGGQRKFIPGFGDIVRKDGMRLDAMREAAVEAGYLHDAGFNRADVQASSTIRHLLDAMDAENRGARVYRHDRAPEPTKAERADMADEHLRYLDGELDHALGESGLDPGAVTGKQRARVLEIMQKEGVRDPLEALEREAMEWDRNASQKGTAARIPDRIPGWDVPDDARPAPPAGGAAAPVEGPGGAGARRSARGTGAGDRAAANGRADWQRLNEARRGEDPDLVEASKQAERTPEPQSTDPEKAPSAAEKAAAEADKLLDDIRPKLTDAERAIFDDALERFGQDKTARETIVRDGAACLAAAVV